MANKQEEVIHRVSLAGRVVEAKSNGAKPLNRALVRIVEAPSEFVAPLLTCAGLIGNIDQVVKRLHSALAATSLSDDLRLGLMQLLLEYDLLSAGARPVPFALRLLGAESAPFTTEMLKSARVLLDNLLVSSATTPLISPSGYAITTAAGYFYWLDLPAGSYRLIASLPAAGTRYGGSEPKQVTIAKEAKTTQCEQFELPPTGLRGTVVETSPPPSTVKKAVAMAEVRVMGDKESTYSDANGVFRLTALEAGKDRLVQISKRVCRTSGQNSGYGSTYLSTQKRVTLTQGEVITLEEIQL